MPIGYTHWDSSLKAFLHIKAYRHLLAIFKLGSNAVSLSARLIKWRGVTFVNLRIYIPQKDEFKEYKTFGLIGGGRCMKRNQDPHNCEHSGFATCELDTNLYYN